MQTSIGMPSGPTTSLGLLYDHRDTWATIAKGVVAAVDVFSGLTEMERSTISNRSIKLFTLSGIHNATQSLLTGLDLPDDAARVELAAEYWTVVASHITDWTLARDRKVSAADLRQEYVHAHTLALAALSRVGNALLLDDSKNWKSKLKKLGAIDWSRSNRQWEGRAMNAGRLSKRNVNVTLTGNLIKTHLGIALSVDENQLEKQFQGVGSGRKKAK